MKPTLRVLFIDDDLSMLHRNIDNVSGICAEVFGIHSSGRSGIIGRPGCTLYHALRSANIIFVDNISVTPEIAKKLHLLKGICERAGKRIIVIDKRNL